MATDDPFVPVALVGGPDDWHGVTLRDVYRASEVTEEAQQRDDLGTMLISAHTPPRDPTTEDIAPRAYYSPDPPPAPARVWHFRGWQPPGRDDWHRPLPSDHTPAAVSPDHRGAPLGWTLDGDPTPWHVARIHVHWIYDHEGQGATDLGVWQVTGHSPNHTRHWELVHDPGAGGWTAAPLP